MSKSRFCSACQTWIDPKISVAVHQIREHGENEEQILKDGNCPACIAGFYPHRNCILR